ncbi:S24 family peptidase [Bacteroides sp.]|uniref:S24 family peptidase n=1 Tax=Bacteroides sp. TaxID=29523 RepID=UPI0025BF5DEC|nr:S24 family peptidase [Bacteroides sp.]
MQDIILRIRELMKYYELNISETAEKLGISQPNLSAMLSGKRPIGGNIINKFIISFGINKDWLESGKGEMYDLSTRQIGLRMFMIRNQRKWTSQETADLLKLPVSEYQGIESGKTIPDKQIIDDFIYISNANPAWIYTGIGEKFQDDYIAYTQEQESDKANHRNVISRIEVLMEAANISFSDLAIKCKLSHSTLADFFNSDKPDDNNLIDIIASSTGANKNWILTGSGSPFEDNSPLADDCAKTFDNIFGSPQKADTRPRIPYTAAAGSLTSAVEGITANQCEQIPRINIFPEYDFTIIIKGNSMEPKYEGGDEVACKRIDSTSFIQWGKVHVLDTAQGILIKRTYEDGEKIRCVSYNPEYPDFSIDKNEIYSMSLVVGLVRL